VPYPKNVVLLRFETSESHSLELVHDRLFDLLRDRSFGERDNAARVLPFALYRADERFGEFFVAPNDLGLGIAKLLFRVPVAGQIRDGRFP
jgi:hypothetical protein